MTGIYMDGNDISAMAHSNTFKMILNPINIVSSGNLYELFIPNRSI